MVYADKSDSPGICFVILGFGYVESALVGKHVYQFRVFADSPSQESPQTAVETLRLLAADFLELYRNQARADEFDIETFQEWLYSLGGANCDSMPCDGTGGFGHWWPYPAWADILSAPKEVFLEVFEQAEKLLCAALNPESFEGDEREAVIQWQQEHLKHQNRLDSEYSDIDDLLEKSTYRPGNGERFI